MNTLIKLVQTTHTQTLLQWNTNGIRILPQTRPNEQPRDAFLGIISGAVLTLISLHLPLFSGSSDIASLNCGLGVLDLWFPTIIYFLSSPIMLCMTLVWQLFVNFTGIRFWRADRSLCVLCACLTKVNIPPLNAFLHPRSLHNPHFNGITVDDAHSRGRQIEP